MITIFLALVLSFLAVPLTALILDFWAKRSGATAAGYGTALKLQFWQFSITLGLALVWSLASDDQLVLAVLSTAASIAVFFYLAKRFYHIAPKAIIKLYILWQMSIAFVGAIAVILIRSFIFIPFYVSGDSMIPNLNPDDYILVERFDRDFRRGDIVVFTEKTRPGQYIIKRIVGLPGEKIVIKAGGLYKIGQGDSKGTVIEEPYLPAGTKTAWTKQSVFELGPEQYLVLGDNRKNSEDSRQVGPIPKADIIGRLWFDFSAE